jgi:hypothetical protein
VTKGCIAEDEAGGSGRLAVSRNRLHLYASKQFIDAARPARRAPGDRWFLGETFVKVAWPLDLHLSRV